VLVVNGAYGLEVYGLSSSVATRNLARSSFSRSAAAPASSSSRPAPAPSHAAATSRPIIPPDVPQYFSPEAAAAVSAPLRPVVYGAVNVRFVDPKMKVDTTELIVLTTPISDGAVAVDWDQAKRVEWAPEMLERDVPDGVTFAALPAPALKARNYDSWSKQLAASIAAGEGFEVLRSPSTGELSRPGEEEREFRARIQQAARESRDRGLDAVRKKYAARQAALDDKLRRAQQTAARESEQATGQKLQTAISVGATIVGALFGKKSISVGTIGRATTAARGFERSMKESQDAGRALDTVAAVNDQRKALEDEIQAETAKLTGGDVATETLEKVSVKAKKTNLTVKLVALVWTK